MAERRKRLLAIFFIFVVSVTYFGCGYYFGVVDRPRRQPLHDPNGTGRD